MGLVAALSTGKAILIGIVSGLVVVLVAGASISALRKPRHAAGPDIPPAMRPGPSDPDLEKPLLEKLIAAGLVLVVIMALWLPGVFLRENVTNADDTRALLAASVQRGYLTTLVGNEANQLGFNCQRCHGQGLRGGQNLFNQNLVPVPNLTTVCGGAKYGHALIKSLDDIINTISQGRTGTDMPSWSVRYAGAMDDQQINDLVNYILSIQKIPAKDNICVNPPAKT